ncbi:hypothetical protein GWK47_013342 [Chionoecetes opilio]|uniref:Uncharacterized protein n=1 Tax=Chionoecetes opilio TaxID=41210 RepID=A0A8J4XWP2_CHIOP|nr:hypothetical protein GWK47_013342 [Chionoecetes opilio]
MFRRDPNLLSFIERKHSDCLGATQHSDPQQSDPQQDDLNVRVHRSGSQYATMTPPLPGQSSPPTSQQGASSSNSVTIIHDTITGPKFTGRDEDGMSVYTFLRESGDLICKRQLTNDEDKINVLREKVASDQCPARSILHSVYFLTCKNYENFRKAFVTTFATTSKLGPMSSLFRLSSVFRDRVPSHNVYDALMHASSTRAGIVDVFANSPWVDADSKMTLESVGTLISYIHFLTMLSPAAYHKFQGSQLLPTESLWEHAQEFLSTKERVDDQAIRMAMNTDRQRSPVSSQSGAQQTPIFPNRSKQGQKSRLSYRFRSPSVNSRRNYSQHRRNMRSPSKERDQYRGQSRVPNNYRYQNYFCSFCNISGHTLSHCRVVNSTKYCAFHQSRTHDTHECVKLHQQQQQQPSHPPGDGQRVHQNTPT